MYLLPVKKSSMQYAVGELLSPVLLSVLVAQVGVRTHTKSELRQILSRIKGALVDPDRCLLREKKRSAIPARSSGIRTDKAQ